MVGMALAETTQKETVNQYKLGLQEKLIEKDAELAWLKKNKKLSTNVLQEKLTQNNPETDTLEVAWQTKLNQKNAKTDALKSKKDVAISALRSELIDKDAELKNLQKDIEASMNALRAMHAGLQKDTAHNGLKAALQSKDLIFPMALTQLKAMAIVIGGLWPRLKLLSNAKRERTPLFRKGNAALKCFMIVERMKNFDMTILINLIRLTSHHYFDYNRFIWKL